MIRTHPHNTIRIIYSHSVGAYQYFPYQINCKIRSKLPLPGFGIGKSFTILSLSYPPALSIITFFIFQKKQKLFPFLVTCQLKKKLFSAATFYFRIPKGGSATPNNLYNELPRITGFSPLLLHNVCSLGSFLTLSP
jgi:hypothetical protein